MDILKNIKFIIFDFDGTLFDLRVDWDRLRQYLKASTDRGLGHIIQEYVDNGEEEKLKLITNMEIDGVGGRSVDPVTIDTLRNLINKGTELAIFTRNSRSVVEVSLKGTSLDGKIKIIGREDVRQQKPQPEGIDALTNLLGVQKSETILVGDTHHDIDAARNA